MLTGLLWRSVLHRLAVFAADKAACRSRCATMFGSFFGQCNRISCIVKKALREIDNGLSDLLDGTLGVFNSGVQDY